MQKKSCVCNILICIILLVEGFVSSTFAQGLSNQYQQLQEEHYLSLYLRGDYQAALDQLQKEIDTRPELAEVKAFRYIYWLSDRANIYFQLGRVDEAIADLESAVETYPEPAFMLRLALLYRYRGRMDDYRALLESAEKPTARRWTYYSYEQNLLALGQLAELRGENPKQLLSSIFMTLMDNRPGFAPGFIGAGDLAYRRGAYDLSDQYYRKALDIDENNLDALAGLAETYWKSNDPRVEEILKRLLAINPNHFRAKAVQAELLLDRSHAPQALELIQECLAINPNHLRLRSLQAAAYFLLDDLDALKRVREEVLHFNPHCSEIDFIPGRIASRHYRFQEGIQFQEKALQTDPDNVEARAQYALDLLRIGEDQKGKEQLEKAFAADPYNVIVFNSLHLLDALESFDTIKRGPFIVRFPKQETLIWSEDVLSQLEEAFDLYQRKYHIQLHTPIHIQVFDNHDDFMVRSVGLPGAIEFMGICFGQLVTMDSPTARTRLSMNWRSVLWHEFVHVITLQKTRNRMPRWLSEGISVYEETQRSPAWGQKLDPQYKALVESEDLPGVSDLESYFVQPKTPNHLMLGYFLAGEFSRFYVENYGADSLADALDLVGKGTEVLSALANACHTSVSDLDRQFQAYLENRLAVLKNLPSIETQENLVQKMLGGEAETKPNTVSWIDRESPFTLALRSGARALQEQRWDEAEQAFEQAFTLYPDFTGPASPLHQLTHLYEQWGKEERLIQTLWRRVEWDSLDFEACQKLIPLHEKNQQWQQVIRAANLALSIDPFHRATHRTLLKAYKKTENLSKAIQEADKLAVLDTGKRIQYRMERIQLLVRLHQKDQAKKETVLLLEEFPHYWKAQQVLLALTDQKNQNEDHE